MIAKEALRQAYMEAHDGWPVDRVIADPALNERFVDSCRQHGLAEPAAILNRKLMNVRKAKWLQGVRASRRGGVPDSKNCVFAAQVAARHLEHRDQVTLDDILCDPERAMEFDALARQITPGYSALDYRWAASICVRVAGFDRNSLVMSFKHQISSSDGSMNLT